MRASTTSGAGDHRAHDDKSSFDYSLEQRLSCFCPLGGVWAKLNVKADTIADAVFLADNSQLTLEERSQYRTINALLRDISQIDTSRCSVIVMIDTIYNFPSYFCSPPSRSSMVTPEASWWTRRCHTRQETISTSDDWFSLPYPGLMLTQTYIPHEALQRRS
jgi:hypothetical protein